MTPINSLDSVLQAGFDAATQAQAKPVEGEKLADARAQVLQGGVAAKSHLLQPNNDMFSLDKGDDPNDTDDARLNRALRSLAEKFQAGQAAQAAVADEPETATGAVAAEQTSGKELAYIGSWVGAATSAAPVTTTSSSSTTSTTTTTTTQPAVTAPTSSGSTSGSSSGTNGGNAYGKYK